MNKVQCLHIIRGIPGAGKSTLANKIVKSSKSPCDHWENDMYFLDTNCNYNWNGKDIIKAVKWCENHVRESLKQGHDCVVANTFTTLKELQTYIDMANEFGIPFVVWKCDGGFQNIHNVPTVSVERMKNRWQDFPGEMFYKG